MVDKDIEWTKSAVKNLKKIHAFYRKTASKEVADKIVSAMFPFVLTLKKQSNIGQIEPTLKHLNLGHRYLVLGHHKIIYTQRENTVYITHVFDTRQHPKKLK